METGRITDIIGKFLSGKCTDEEFAYLLYWYESFDELEEPEISSGERQLLRERIRERIRTRIPALEEAGAGRPSGNLRRFFRVAWKYAAAAAVVGLVGWIALRHSAYTGPGVSSPDRQASGSLVLDNRSDRVHRVQLPDSSTVWLNPGSKLVYPEKFLGAVRLVRLEGEGFFDIAPDRTHPFQVVSRGLVTRVLGTRFLVRAYRGKPLEVAVLSGKVAVSPAAGAPVPPVILLARQKGVFDSSGQQVVKAGLESSVVSRWHKADLSFEDVPLTQVASRLDSQFAIRIHFEDSALSSYRLNADFNHQDLTAVLEMLEKSLNIHYEIQDDSLVRLYSNPGP